eukprot:346254-Pelagomonas_calceolata.AAC.14
METTARRSDCFAGTPSYRAKIAGRHASQAGNGTERPARLHEAGVTHTCMHTQINVRTCMRCKGGPARTACRAASRSGVAMSNHARDVDTTAGGTPGEEGEQARRARRRSRADGAVAGWEEMWADRGSQSIVLLSLKPGASSHLARRCSTRAEHPSVAHARTAAEGLCVAETAPSKGGDARSSRGNESRIDVERSSTAEHLPKCALCTATAQPGRQCPLTSRSPNACGSNANRCEGVAAAGRPPAPPPAPSPPA